MTDRENALQALAAGDIFHAEGSNGASLICLVLSVTATTIRARTVTTQKSLEFDRFAGTAKWGAGHGIIDSMAQPSMEIKRELLNIDHKFRFERDLDRLKLTSAEKRALIDVQTYFEDNPI